MNFDEEVRRDQQEGRAAVNAVNTAESSKSAVAEDRMAAEEDAAMHAAMEAGHAFLNRSAVPKNEHDAQRYPGWKKADRDEYDGLVKADTFDVVQRPRHEPVLPSIMVHNIKLDEQHWNAAIHVLRYLLGTRESGLHYVKGRNDEHLGFTEDILTKLPLNQQLGGFVDANWSSNPADAKPVGGYAFLLANAAISWKATCESEGLQLTTSSMFHIYDRQSLGWLQNQVTDQLCSAVSGFKSLSGFLHFTTARGFKTRHNRGELIGDLILQPAKALAIVDMEQ